MNTPIISPWFLYAADVFGILRVVFIILSFFILIGCIATFLSALDVGYIKLSKYTIKGFVAGVIILILGVCCPSKDTCYKMALAKFATPQNIQAITEYVGNTASDLSDSMSDAIKDIMDYSVDRIYDIRNNRKASDDE